MLLAKDIYEVGIQMQPENSKLSNFGQSRGSSTHNSHHRYAVSRPRHVHKVLFSKLDVYPAWKLTGRQIFRSLLYAKVLGINERRFFLNKIEGSVSLAHWIVAVEGSSQKRACLIAITDFSTPFTFESSPRYHRSGRRCTHNNAFHHNQLSDVIGPKFSQ